MPADAAAHRKLTTKLASLSLRPQIDDWHEHSVDHGREGGRGGRHALHVPRATRSRSNPSRSSRRRLTGGVSLAMRIAGTDQRLAVGHNDWKKGTLTTGSSPDAVAASGAWTSGDTYTLTVARYRTPFTTTYQLRFAGDQLFVRAEQNVGRGRHADRGVCRQARDRVAAAPIALLAARPSSGPVQEPLPPRTPSTQRTKVGLRVLCALSGERLLGHDGVNQPPLDKIHETFRPARESHVPCSRICASLSA